MDLAPVDYASGLGQIPNPVAALQQAIAFKTGLAQKQAETQQVQAQTADLQAQAQARAAQVQREAEFQRDLGAVGANPSAHAISSLVMKYPEFADHIKQGWDVKDAATKQADLTSTGEVYSAAASGNWRLAAKQVQARIDADRAAGTADDGDQAMLEAINTAAQGDPNAQKQVLTLLGTHLAAVTGPEHFASVYGALKGGYTLAPGAVRYDDAGNVVAHSPIIQGADGEYYKWDDVMGGPGGTPKPGAQPQEAPAQSDVGGFDHAVTTVLGNEGGYTPKDMNGSPTMRGINWKANAAKLTAMGFTPATFKNMTDDQAKAIYRTYWDQSGAANLPPNMQTPYFDAYVRSPKAAKAALAQSKGDPAAFMGAVDNYFGKLAGTPSGAPYAKAWADRDANNRLIAMGGAPSSAATSAGSSSSGPQPIIPGRNSPGEYRVLTDAEVKQRGLDPNQQYQLNTKNGQITGLGNKSADASDALTKYGIAPNETGPSVLAKLPANMANQVKALAEGRLGTISSFALAKPYWQTMLQLATQYDPSFDMNAAPARKAAITSFTGTGKGAMLVGSANRVANHMDLLASESKKLAGPELGNSTLNSLAAGIGQSFEPADAKAYDTEVTFVAGELGKLAKAGVVTQGEADTIVNNLGRKNSASTRESAIKAAVGIIAGAIGPLKDQYNSAFTNGSTRPKIPWVSPKAQEIYKRIAGVDMSLSGDDNNAGAATGGADRKPPPGATKTATGPNGQKAALVNGHWVPY